MGKLRMRTILLIYQICILLLALIILVICQQIQLQIATAQIQISSREILDLQNKRALNIQSIEAITVISWAFLMVTQKMSDVISLGLFLDKYNISVQQNTLQCKEAQQFFTAQIAPFQFCYTELFENEQNQKFLDIMNTIQIHQFTFDFFHVSQQVYLVSFQNNLQSGYYPTKSINEPIEAFYQEWFIDYTTALKQTQTYIPYFLSELYTQSNYNYLLSTFSMLMLNNQLQPIGIASLLINFPNIQQFLHMDLLNIFVLHVNGTMVYSKSFIQHNMSTDLHYIFDQNITGFNYDDWQSILYSLNNSKNPIIIYNSLLNQNVYVKAQQLDTTPLITLTLTNVTYAQEINTILDNNFSSMVQTIMQSNLYVAISALIVILFSLIPLKIIFQSAYTVMEMMVKYLNGKFDYKIREQVFSNHIASQIQDNSLTQLFLTYQGLDKKLIASQYNKSESCRLIEGFHYPQSHKNRLNYKFDELTDSQSEIQPAQLASLLRQELNEYEE